MRRWLCRLSFLPFSSFHDFEIIETYDQHTRKLKCPRCGRYFAMSDRFGAILPWDHDFEKLTRLVYRVPRSNV